MRIFQKKCDSDDKLSETLLSCMEYIVIFRGRDEWTKVKNISISFNSLLRELSYDIGQMCGETFEVEQDPGWWVQFISFVWCSFLFSLQVWWRSWNIFKFIGFLSFGEMNIFGIIRMSWVYDNCFDWLMFFIFGYKFI